MNLAGNKFSHQFILKIIHFCHWFQFWIQESSISHKINIVFLLVLQCILLKKYHKRLPTILSFSFLHNLYRWSYEAGKIWCCCMTMHYYFKNKMYLKTTTHILTLHWPLKPLTTKTKKQTIPMRPLPVRWPFTINTNITILNGKTSSN